MSNETLGDLSSCQRQFGLKESTGISCKSITFFINIIHVINEKIIKSIFEHKVGDSLIVYFIKSQQLVISYFINSDFQL